MEELRSNPGRSRLDRWDEVPRDGPAVFLVNRAAFDRGEIVGGWVSITSDIDDLTASVEDIIGDSISEDAEQSWVVIDQVGLGPAMVDEDAAIEQLAVPRQ